MKGYTDFIDMLWEYIAEDAGCKYENTLNNMYDEYRDRMRESHKESSRDTSYDY